MSINGANQEVRHVPVPMMEDILISSLGVTGSNSFFNSDYLDYYLTRLGSLVKSMRTKCRPSPARGLDR